MTRVLFIHGTSTRYSEDYLRTFGRINTRLKTWRGSTEVLAFPWGEYWGAELNPAFVSIPGTDERQPSRVLGGGDESQAPITDAERWALLYADPLAELRQLLGGQVVAENAPQTQAGLALRRATRQLAESPISESLAPLLAEGEIETSFPAAAGQIAGLFGQGELRLPLQVVAETGRDVVRLALARAIVAMAAVIAYQGGTYPEVLLDAALRDRIVAEVEQTLGGGAVLGGAPDWRTVPQALAATHLLLRPWRVELTHAVLQFLGDIFIYQAKGEAIRGAIAEQLGAGPTVLLAHSLGGIACAELLLTDQAARQKVPLLITVGSQVGMLDELGVLVANGGRTDEAMRLPDDFPPWLNICDRNDMLSFRAAPRFHGRVRDVELDGADPFPHAHNAYWRRDRVWEHILTAIGDPENVQLQLR